MVALNYPYQLNHPMFFSKSDRRVPFGRVKLGVSMFAHRVSFLSSHLSLLLLLYPSSLFITTPVLHSDVICMQYHNVACLSPVRTLVGIISGQHEKSHAVSATVTITRVTILEQQY